MSDDRGDVDVLSLDPAFLERFRVLDELGRGGMGVVFLAEDRARGGRVAVKVLSPQLAGDEITVARFLREADVAARLRHPAVVGGRGGGRLGTTLYLCFDYVEGGSLRKLLVPEQPLEPDRALPLMVTIAQGLAAAHDAGVVHRDLKPENVLLGADGRPRIADFGIAVLAAERDRLTRTGILLGTPAYMAPEQILGEAVDGRADVYSLGVMAFEALAGRLPHQAPSLPDLLRDKVTAEAPRLKTLRPDLPATVTSAVDACLARNPADRSSSASVAAREFSDALTALDLSQSVAPERTVAKVEPSVHSLRAVERRPLRPRTESSVPAPTTAALPVVTPHPRSHRSRVRTMVGLGSVAGLLLMALVLGRTPPPDTTGSMVPPPPPSFLPPAVVAAARAIVAGPPLEAPSYDLVMAVHNERLTDLWQKAPDPGHETRAREHRAAARSFLAADAALLAVDPNVIELARFAATARPLPPPSSVADRRNAETLMTALAPLRLRQALYAANPDQGLTLPLDPTRLLSTLDLVRIDGDAADWCSGAGLVAADPTAPTTLSPGMIKTRDGRFYDGPSILNNFRGGAPNAATSLFEPIRALYEQADENDTGLPRSRRFGADLSDEGAPWRRVGIRLAMEGLSPDTAIEVSLVPLVPGLRRHPPVYVTAALDGTPGGRLDCVVEPAAWLLEHTPCAVVLRLFRLSGAQDYPAVTVRRLEVWRSQGERQTRAEAPRSDSPP